MPPDIPPGISSLILSKNFHGLFWKFSSGIILEIPPGIFSRFHVSTNHRKECSSCLFLEITTGIVSEIRPWFSLGYSVDSYSEKISPWIPLGNPLEISIVSTKILPWIFFEISPRILPEIPLKNKSRNLSKYLSMILSIVFYRKYFKNSLRIS